MYSAFVLVIVVGPLTVLLDPGFDTSNQLILINTFLRMFGLLAFSVLFIQIVLGSNMSWFTNVIGAKAYKYHIVLAFSVLFLIILHPLFYSLLLLAKSGVNGLLSAFFPSGLFGKEEVYISLGRISFSILVLVFIAGYYRTKPILRRNWKKVHLLSIAAFFLVAIHSWNIGSDVGSIPFVWFYFLAVFAVVLIAIREMYNYIKY